MLLRLGSQMWLWVRVAGAAILWLQVVISVLLLMKWDGNPIETGSSARNENAFIGWLWIWRLGRR